ncbi:hypothetical protein [Chelativorans sp.]|uniref:hypothetical protein n=1 Tax=Chelativorans sp. TaxID=2203393 RepID=UPI0028116DA1|nr:hypothetical protein [Chelativorans sp.]
MQRLILGLLAGLSATTTMTAAMRHLWLRLQPRNRYPLPPRELVERVNLPAGEDGRRINTLLAHFGFGALAGAGFALLPRSLPSGILYGLSVWTVSYLGWIPAVGLLKPATRHPLERNLLMLAVHMVWGAMLAANLRELERAGGEIFAGGPAKDATKPHLSRRFG